MGSELLPLIDTFNGEYCGEQPLFKGDCVGHGVKYSISIVSTPILQTLWYGINISLPGLNIHNHP